MPRVIKADHADFDVPVVVTVTDSEGNVIPGAGLPAGFTLTGQSDNPACFDVTQDSSDPLLFHCRVGGPNSDGTPSSANFSVMLTDGNGALVATDTEAIVVTAGDPAAVSGIDITFPADIPNN